MDAGCKGCTKREVGCHGSCESYLEWRSKYDKEKAIVAEKKHKLREIKRDIQARARKN